MSDHVVVSAAEALRAHEARENARANELSKEIRTEENAVDDDS